MPQTAAIPGAMFRVGVGVLPVPPRYYRERRCVPCSWAAALGRLVGCWALGAWCHARRRLVRAYLRALVSEAVPAWALPALSRVVWWTPPPSRRLAVAVLLVEVGLLLGALT